MKWQYYLLASDDERAKASFSENLKCGRLALAQKLLTRFTLGQGKTIAIALEDLDVQALPNFSYATYQSGKTWIEAAGSSSIPMGQRPIDGLIHFITEYLRNAQQGAVVMHNILEKMSEPYWDNPDRFQHWEQTRRAFFVEEVYHVITNEDTRPELIEDTIREADHHWFVGVCAQHVAIPENNVLSEESLEQLACGTEHIFVPSFDGGGYLVWSPG